MNNVINTRTSRSDPKKIRERWDAQVAKALKDKKYLNVASVLRKR